MKTDWYKNAIVYQVYPFSFKDSDNDGWGDIKGILSKLDYIKDLGVTAIWFSPLYKSPDYDYGYDISDYKAIDEKFGTMEDFDLLLKECHKRDLKVIMDMVINHTSIEHEWFKKAIEDPKSEYRDYYIIRKGKRGGERKMKNPYIPFPSEILEVIKHTEKEYTFRMEFTGKCRPGQFFEVSMPKYGEAPISISGIGENYIDLTIRRVGRVTDEVFEHYTGQTLLLRGPYGNGFDTDLYADGETVVVAGGTGVSPVRGVIEALSCMPNAKEKYVIAGFRSPDDMLFRDDLARWKDELNLILTVDGAPEGYDGNIGLVTKYIADLPLQDPASAKAIVVGPPPMMKFTIIELQKKGFKNENITVSYERKMCCGLGKCGHCKMDDKYVCLDGPVFNYVDAMKMVD